MKEGLIFANAAVKAREENLFSGDRLARMLEADALRDAVKILIEAGYGGGTVPEDPSDFESILSAEAAVTEKFIDGIAPEGAGFECFRLQADYHNMKALVKARYTSDGEEGALRAGGLIDIDLLKEKLERENPDINPFADEALAEIAKAAAEGKPSPRKIDTAFDRAMFKDIAARLRVRSAPEELKEYFRVYADCLNLASFVRTLGIGGNFAFFEDVYTEGGSIPKEDFEKAFQEGVSAVAVLAKRTPLAAYADALAAGDVTGFEVARDDYLLGIFRKSKAEMFSVAPVMGYYLAKQNEIRVLRIALVCIKNGVDKQEIRKKLRELYA